MLLQEIQEKKEKGHSLQNILLHETNSLGKLYVLHELMRSKETLDSGECAEERVEVRVGGVRVGG